MKLFNTASLAIFFASLFLSSVAFSQNKELNELKGYSPPPMFGGSPTPALSPAPIPVQQPVPEPVVTQPVEVPRPVAKQVPQKNSYSAEDILSFPVNSNSIPAAPVPKELPLPTAVPAAKVDQALPLPGSVPPAPKKKPEQRAPAKTEKKKETPKKTAPKENKKPVEEKKQKTKPAETVKPKPKEPVKKTEPVKKETVKAKLVTEKTSPPVKTPEKPKPTELAPKEAEKPASAPAPVSSRNSNTLPELPVPDKKAKPYRLDGKKNMPVVKPTGVDKAPLPDIPAAVTANPPTANEQIIDKALQDRLMRPDVKSIIKSDAPAMKTTPLTENPQPKASAAPAMPSAVKKTEKLAASMLSIEYKPGVTDIQDDHKKIIETDILPKLRKDQNSRLQIIAYASASKEGQSSARRLSLARSMELRAYILEQDIRPSRIDIRALGDKTEEKPVDRVDLRFIPSN